MQAIQECIVPIHRDRFHRIWLMRIHCQLPESSWFLGLVQSDSDMRVDPMCAPLCDTVNQQPKLQSKCKVTRAIAHDGIKDLATTRLDIT